MNLVRAFTRGGYASLDKISSWSEASFGSFHVSQKYDELVNMIKKAINFMTAIGIDIKALQLNHITMFTSHEALLLDHEKAMIRIGPQGDSTTPGHICLG